MKSACFNTRARVVEKIAWIDGRSLWAWSEIAFLGGLAGRVAAAGS